MAGEARLSRLAGRSPPATAQAARSHGPAIIAKWRARDTRNAAEAVSAMIRILRHKSRAHGTSTRCTRAAAWVARSLVAGACAVHAALSRRADDARAARARRTVARIRADVARSARTSTRERACAARAARRGRAPGRWARRARVAARRDIRVRRAQAVAEMRSGGTDARAVGAGRSSACRATRSSVRQIHLLIDAHGRAARAVREAHAAVVRWRAAQVRGARDAAAPGADHVGPARRTVHRRRAEILARVRMGVARDGLPLMTRSRGRARATRDARNARPRLADHGVARVISSAVGAVGSVAGVDTCRGSGRAARGGHVAVRGAPACGSGGARDARAVAVADHVRAAALSRRCAGRGDA